VVPTHALQIEDGGGPDRRHLGKIEKFPYFGRGSSDFDKFGTMTQLDPLNR